MNLTIILLIVILILLFRDVIIKIITGNKFKVLSGNKVITQEYEVKNIENKNIHMDVLDTNVKIVFDNEIDSIKINTSYLAEKFSYRVEYDDKNIKIIKNNKMNLKKLGSSGKVLIKIPQKVVINTLKMLVVNGDVEIYDSKINELIINEENGLLKIETLESTNLKIYKKNGDATLNNVTINDLDMNIEVGNGDFSNVYGESMNIKLTSGDFIFVNIDDEYEIKKLNVDVLNGKKKLDVNYIQS